MRREIDSALHVRLDLVPVSHLGAEPEHSDQDGKGQGDDDRDGTLAVTAEIRYE